MSSKISVQLNNGKKFSAGTWKELIDKIRLEIMGDTSYYQTDFLNLIAQRARAIAHVDLSFQEPSQFMDKLTNIGFVRKYVVTADNPLDPAKKKEFDIWEFGYIPGEDLDDFPPQVMNMPNDDNDPNNPVLMQTLTTTISNEPIE